MATVDPRLLTFARAMRRDSAPAEIRLWRLLRDRQLNGFKFRRQHPIGPFIADFYCAQHLGCRATYSTLGANDLHAANLPKGPPAKFLAFFACKRFD
jgi:hypothetical protein